MTFFSNETDDIPWPSLAAPVLTSGDRWASAHFDALCPDDRSAIADGFWESADRLATAWLADDTRRPYSGLAAATSLPLLFLYRHALEASMKAMLADYSGRSEAEIAGFRHDLLKLWGECRPLLWPYDDDPGEDLLAVERVVWAYHGLDPRNDVFRYSHDLKGNPISMGRDCVDVRELQRGMRGVANFFDCADTELHERYGS